MHWFFLITCMMLFHGCQDSSGTEILKQWMDDLNQKEKLQEEGVVLVKLPAPYVYSSSDLRSPFSIPDSLFRDNSNVYAGDMDRPKEPLEAFALDALRMVGTLSARGEKKALILDPNGLIYQVGVGAYMGNHYGKILEVHLDHVILREIVGDEYGQWNERKVKLMLLQ